MLSSVQKRVLTQTGEGRSCAQCSALFQPTRHSQAFCCDRCRMAFHTDRGIEGAVARVQRTKAGASIVIHLTGPAAESALGQTIGAVVRVVPRPG
jgi:protein-arginine kinase activator protein McsA